MGVGKATQQASLLEGAVTDLTLIGGQKPMVTRRQVDRQLELSRGSGQIGCKVTFTATACGNS